MTEVAASELKQAVESRHGGTATFVQAVAVDEQFQGQPVWRGTVHIFDLKGHPTAKRAYAWSYELPDGRRRFFAVLHAPPIRAPRDAVRAAIVSEAKAKMKMSMRMKIFRGASDAIVERQVNDWLANEGSGITVIRSDSAIKEASVIGKDANGKKVKRPMRYSVTTVWYEPP